MTPAAASLNFTCDFPGCDRSFSTKTGKGVHHRRTHPDWYDAQQPTVAVKARWTEEETQLLARKEVELMGRGERFLNQALVQSFPERSLESIKSKRKQLAYWEIVGALSAAPPARPDQPRRLRGRAEREHTVFRQKIEQYLLSLPEPTSDRFEGANLAEICRQLASKAPDAVLDELSLYLRGVFPLRPRRMGVARTAEPVVLIGRQKRRADYARTQDLWRKNRNKCLRMLLDDTSGAKPPPKDVMAPFWEAIMTGDTSGSPGGDNSAPAIDGLWGPIGAAEIQKALPACTTSAGPDGLTARFLRRVPMEILERILNLVLWCGRAPSHLLESVTTLIPKKANAQAPSDFRPITVSSVLIRTLHKVLATRIARSIHLDQRQRAFRPTDGCSDNVFLLDLILRHHHQRHKALFLASLDIAKAFDSVSHDTIGETLEVVGVPGPMKQYIMDVYERSTTTLCCDSWTSAKIKPSCGVKQGDPMSPVIFNMVMDRLLRRLPEDIGARIGGLNVNAAAFADDLLLFASTPTGLQRLLDVLTEFLGKCGLQVNASKCMTISLKNVPHDKKTVVDPNTVFQCQGRILLALKRSDNWVYFGIPFSPEGRIKLDVVQKLRVSLEKLSRAPLKPQQRLFGLRTMVVPGLFHQVVLGNVNLSILRRCDKLIRGNVKRWLALPSDAPNAYFHANIKDGGLGIAALRWHAPLARLRRLQSLPLNNAATGGAPGVFLEGEIKGCKTRLLDDGQSLSTSDDVRKRWARQLYAKVDGKGLQGSVKVPQQHVWVQDGTRLLSGRDFLQACKLRINALPAKSRTTRGRPIDRQCRAGCRRPETLNHVSSNVTEHMAEGSGGTMQ